MAIKPFQISLNIFKNENDHKDAADHSNAKGYVMICDLLSIHFSEGYRFAIIKPLSLTVH